MKKKLNRLNILLIGILFFTGCNNNTVFRKSVTLPATGWSKDSVLIFEYQATDTVGVYNIVADIRNDGSYRYQNFWLFINSMSPDSLIYRDTLECVLADNYGKWIGKGSGSLYHLPVSFLQGIKFPVPGVYTFEMIQGMREDPLNGIHDIGIRIIKN
jgi:gliding motility-associated lipoprotein GldH